jgi:circadian clock protein KaiB
MPKLTRSKAKTKKPPEVVFHFRLYIISQSEKSLAAISNLQKICEEHLKDRYRIELVDLGKNPALAKDHHIVAIPTLIRKLPVPIRRIIGDLSKTEQVLVGLDLVESRGQR